MPSAFNRSPGGCCCDVPTGFHAIGVDDIENPTITRIPRNATIRFSGAVYVPASGQLECVNPAALNSRTIQLTAHAPTYPVGTPTVYPGSNGSFAFMVWTSALSTSVVNPVWPGNAGGNWIGPTDALLPGPPNAFVFGSTNPGWGSDFMGGRYTAGSAFNHLQNYPDTGWLRLGVNSGGNPSCQPQEVGSFAELSLVCATPRSTSDFLAEFVGPVRDVCTVMLAASLAWRSSPGTSAQIAELQLVKSFDDIPFRNHQFYPTDTGGHRICVIPDSITLEPMWNMGFNSAPIPGNPFSNGYFYNTMTTTIEFSDWYEGPIWTSRP